MLSRLVNCRSRGESEEVTTGCVRVPKLDAGRGHPVSPRLLGGGSGRGPGSSGVVKG